MASKSAAQTCEELLSGLADIQLQALGELRAMVDTSNEELQQLCEQSDATLFVALAGLLKRQHPAGACDSEETSVTLEAWQALVELLDLLEPNGSIASRLVREFGLVDCVFRAVMRVDGNTSFLAVGLACILALKRHNVVLSSESPYLAEAIAAMLGASSDDEKHMPLQLEVLQALSAESAQCAREVQQTVRARLDAKSNEFSFLVLEYLFKSYEPTAKVRNIHGQARECWNLDVNADLLVRLLRSGQAFERAIVLKCLRIDFSNEHMTNFLDRGGLGALELMLVSGDIHQQEQALALMKDIAKSSASHRLQVVEYQVAHDQVEILTEDIYHKMLDLSSASTDYELIKQQICSESEEFQRRGFTLLPKNIEVLAPFCIDHGLVPVLTKLLLDEGERPTSEFIKNEVWTLLVHIVFELPRLGVWKLRESCELASLALRFAANALVESSLALRKQALVYLAAPLNKSQAIRDQLVNDDGAIPTLVDLLSREEESVFAALLSDFLRDLLNGGRNYEAELDLVVRGILENEKDEHDVDCGKVHSKSKMLKTRRNYVNLLSLYRRAEACVLGFEANDDIENLRLCIAALENGSELEKLIVLKHLKRFAASWSSIHLGILRENLLAVVCVVAHEPPELKQLAVRVLWILAKLDRVCCERVMAAQAQFWPDEPIFSTREAGWAVNHEADDEVGEEKDGEDEYEYSEHESEIDSDDLADAEDESATKKQKLS